MKTDLPIHSDAKTFLEKILAKNLSKLNIDNWRKEIE
jgi:thiamine pyrophosphate-dependent acetolactate synthase large subunit-like protein